MGALWSMFFGSKKMNILMQGVYSAGRTAILYKLKSGEFRTDLIPTHGINVESLIHNNTEFTIVDPGASDILRSLARGIYKDWHGVIFVLDSSDRNQMDDVRQEFDKVINDQGLRQAVILILANKQDLPDAMTSEEIREKLNLSQIRHRQWHLQLCSALTGQGLNEGLTWLGSANDHTPEDVV